MFFLNRLLHPNNNMQILDNKFAEVIQDPDNNIKYLKVVSSDEYNSSELRNDTLYFINDITDQVFKVNDILDVALSNYGSENHLPTTLWILSVDLEVEEVYLWSGNITTGPFTLRKIWKGFKDGALTFDGTWDYVEGEGYATLHTDAEPFVVLINTLNQLYAFPSLRYKIDGSSEKNRAKLVAPAPGSDDRVLKVSVDKGYGSKLYKEQDQGIIIAFVTTNEMQYSLYYTLYCYISNDSDLKNLIGVNERIFTNNEEIISTYVRRLDDYRVGITYNYYENNAIKAGFRYSKRVMSGVAFHPEFFTVKNKFKPSVILYGATRTDNNNEVPIPTFDMVNRKDNSPLMEFKLTFNNKPIEIQTLNPNDPTSKMPHTFLDDSGFEIVNDFPYGLYLDDKGVPSKAVVKSIYTYQDRLFIQLMGNALPKTPFTLKPSANANTNYYVRYEGNNVAPIADTKDSRVNGWFAFTNGLEYRYNINNVSSPTFGGVEVFWGLHTNLHMSTVSSVFFVTSRKTIDMSFSFSPIISTNEENRLEKVVFVDESIQTPNIGFHVGATVSNVIMGGNIIDV